VSPQAQRAKKRQKIKVRLVRARVAATPSAGWEARRAKNHLYNLQ